MSDWYQSQYADACDLGEAYAERTNKEMALTAERLRELLDYDPDTGVFTWRVTRSSRAEVGSMAGTLAPRRNTVYRQIRVDGRIYYAHRLAWFYVHGHWPSDDVDHINCDGADNSIRNLRPASRSENNGNARKRCNNSSGFKGACWDKRRGRWLAQIRTNGRNRHLGYFDTPEAAHAAYVAAARERFGRFARTA